jgi:serine/threonine-protein kinase
MDQARWQRVKDLFGELEGEPADVRAGILAREPDAEVRREAEALLLALASAGNRFEEPPVLDAELPVSGAEPGQRIGAYEVVREIGRGGMGAVYEARRVDDAFDKRVALKTVVSGHGTTVVRRFRQERQILARLDHPNIAALLDGGVSPSGMPYFVMEYVDGEPIDAAARTRHLNLAARLDLFRSVCSAVQYAHEQLIVHRDLKPANILVSSDGHAKLLDFGIAKLLAETAEGGAALTQTGVLPMTAAYASPEQLTGSPVSVASDIYSLGIILYELTTGVRPFEGMAITAAIQTAAERVATLPSRSVTDESAARAGLGDAGRLRKDLSGELDAIILKAMRPEPLRRYRSVAQFNEDLHRYLSGRPVLAQPDTTGYRLRKFVRRNRLAAAATAIAVLALVGATIVSLRQAAVARTERDAARQAQHHTEQVTQFFREVLGEAKPGKQGRDVTVAAAIDSALPRIDSTLKDQPELRAVTKNTIGSTLTELFMYERARPLVEEAVAYWQQAGQPNHEYADALYNLAGIEAEAGSPARAESLYTASFAMYRALDGDSVAIWAGLNNLAGAVSAQGRFADAIALYESGMAHRADALARDTALRVIMLANIGTALAQMGRYREAEPKLGEALALANAAKLGPGRVAEVLQPLAGTQLFLGRYPEAEASAREAWRLSALEFGADNARAVQSLRMLMNILADAGRCSEALAVAQQILALRKGLSDEDPSVSTALLFGGWCEARLGQVAAGEARVREGLALRRAVFGDSNWATAQGHSMLGDVVAMKGPAWREEALRELQAGYDGLKAALDSTHVRVRQARERLDRVRGQQ